VQQFNWRILVANITLQNRDRDLLQFLRDQGFATFQQIERRYFSQQANCSRRLLQLEEAGYLERRKISEIFGLDFGSQSKRDKKYFPFLLGAGINMKACIFQLSTAYLRLYQQSNRLLKPNLCLHQLILNDVRENLEKELKVDFILNDPKLTILSDIDFDRRKEFTPDLSFECGEYKLAIELERTQKSLNRYTSRFWYYTDSAYSHVLYVYVNDRHLKKLVQYAGSSRRFAFSHYTKPTEILSNQFGYLSLNEFIERVNLTRKRA
jgi:hypothetical protein